MSKLLDIPFDVFFKIFEEADAESLFAIGQCNRRCRDWADNQLLWKEVIRRMQERGIQLPADGFAGFESMSFELLKRCALRACRITRNWSSPEARPTNSFLIDCDPSLYQHGVLHTTRRLRWIIPITGDFFAVKLGYHSSSGFLQIRQRNVDAPRIVVNYQHDWIAWAHCANLAERAWYFIFSEHNAHQYVHTLHVMRFFGFDSDSKVRLGINVAAKYPVYGIIINVFVLDVVRRSLCALYAGSPNGIITMFYVPDWLKKDSVHIDTGIDDFQDTRKANFICWLDPQKEQLVMQVESVAKKKARQYVYALRDLDKHTLPVPVLPFPAPLPPLLKPTRVFDLVFVDTPPNQGPSHDLQSLVSVDHHYFPILPHALGTQVPPMSSHIALSSSFGPDPNPAYVFKHVHAGLAGDRPFLRRMETPLICRMAFEQDYMDSNTTQRFPIGHVLDLRGHELIALGHSCAAWIEARKPSIPDFVPDFDQMEYDLKIAQFPWNMEETEQESKSQAHVDSSMKAEAGLSVCTVLCPPEVDLARVTGLWLDSAQGRIFIGLKWGKFMVLQFD